MDAEETQTKLDDLGVQARAGIGWQVLSHAWFTGLRMVVSIILARLLMPEDFGLLAMAVMVTELARVFQDLGMGPALVQRKELQSTHLTSAFWGTLLMGAILCGMMVAGAPYVGAFFHEPRVTAVLRVISLTFLIAPFIAVPWALLQRELDFRSRFFAGLVGTGAYGVVGITMALTGYSYWSLVGAHLASSVGTTVGVCIVTKYLPPIVPSLRGVKDLYGFGVGVTGVNLLRYITQQVDYLLVGRWLSSAALGLYRKAFTLSHSPKDVLSGVVYPVLFPSLSRLQSNRARAREVYGRALTAVGMVACPGLALLAVTAPDFIPVVLGSQWTGAIIPTQILCAAGMIRAINSPASAVAKAFGRVYSEVWRQGVYAGVLFVAAWVGLRWGIAGVSWGALLATVVFFLLMCHLAWACCGFGATSYVRALRAPLFVGLCVLMLTVATRYLLVKWFVPSYLVLVLTLACGLVSGVTATVFSPFSEWCPVWRHVIAAIDSYRRASTRRADNV